VAFCKRTDNEMLKSFYYSSGETTQGAQVREAPVHNRLWGRFLIGTGNGQSWWENVHRYTRHAQYWSKRVPVHYTSTRLDFSGGLFNKIESGFKGPSPCVVYHFAPGPTRSRRG
jgi:hypothetical protein